ncbi:MAG: hypothetical protein FWF91_08165 [Coriobacteriia bacterium]|nr:hypothetical protein [Coriobacteriia bacterium]
MLFILTGEIQAGKTRWLMRLADEIAGLGVICHGLLTPGVWRTSEPEGGLGSEPGGKSGGEPGCEPGGEGHRYEKLGIEALLLPDGRRFSFAKRQDLVEQDGTDRADWQSSQAGLGWVIPDEAIHAVNRHFDELATSISGKGVALLVVDELGILELLKGKGLTSAVQLLDSGGRELYQHALIIVRKDLLSVAVERFSEAWGEVSVITPDDVSHALVLDTITRLA